MDAVSGCLMLVKGSVFDAVGLLDEQVLLHVRGSGFLSEGETGGFFDHAGGPGGGLPRGWSIARRQVAEALLLRRA